MRNPLTIFRGAAAVLAFGFVAAVSCEPPTVPPSQDPTQVRLVSCPTTTSLTTQAVVGPLGGTVSLGATTVAIPSGALSAPTLITLTIPASEYMEIDVRANDLLSFVFNKPIGVRIDYSRCDNPVLSTAKLSVWHIDTESKALLENMGGTNDRENRSISFTTGHLSNYAVAF